MAREMTRWDPFEDFVSLRDAMDRLFEESFVWPSLLFRRREMGNGQPRTWTLPVDIYETNDDFVIRAYVPGVNPDNMEITIRGDTVTLHGNIPMEEAEGQTWHRRELWYGDFHRAITLPAPIEADKAEANFQNGLLTLYLPKVEEVRPKQIKVQVKK